MERIISIKVLDTSESKEIATENKKRMLESIIFNYSKGKADSIISTNRLTFLKNAYIALIKKADDIFLELLGFEMSDELIDTMKEVTEAKEKQARITNEKLWKKTENIFENILEIFDSK